MLGKPVDAAVFGFDVGSLAGEDRGEGEEHHFDVPPEGVVPDVFQIVSDALRPLDVVASLDLRPPCDAGTHGEAAVFFGRAAFGLVVQHGAGPHDAHGPVQDVEQLGQLVQARLAEELADGGDPVFGHDFLAVPVVLFRDHGAELVHFERLLVLSDAGLGEQGRSLGTEFDGEIDHLEDGHDKEQHDARQADGDIGAPLDGKLELSDGWVHGRKGIQIECSGQYSRKRVP